MLLSVPQAAVFASILFLCVFIVRFSRQRLVSRSDLPPGPPETSFILGNVSDIPSRPTEWKKYHEMSKLYGPVMHLRALNVHLLILDTVQAAVDLLDKRGAIYSDRPHFTLLGELCDDNLTSICVELAMNLCRMGYNWHVTLMQYGSLWRKHRRVLHQHLNETAIVRLHKKQERLNTIFLGALLGTPGDWWSLVHWLAGANILSALYGLEDTKFQHDPWIQLGEEALQIVNGAMDAGLHPVDVFPFLKHIPSWFPGGAFQRSARKAYELNIRSREAPYSWVKARMAEGTAVPCITSALLEADLDDSAVPEEIIKNAAGVAYVAGAETALSVFKSFFLAMVRNPDVQRTAQEEVDRVIPSERLPTLADRDSSKLPYLEAVMRETYRKYPPVPLGLPHKMAREDEYRGMRIPSGTVIIANIWAMTQDEQTYPEPQSFRPDRFLKDGLINADVLDPRNMIFGFGRRICPGRYFADAEIWLMMATMLYCFDILPALDEHGQEVIPSEEMTQGTVIAPVEFECRIVPRSEAKRSLVLSTCEQLS